MQSTTTPTHRERTLVLEGISVNIGSQAQLLAAVSKATLAAGSFAIHTLNLHHCLTARNDAGYRQAYRAARFVTADGAPLELLGRLLGVRPGRVTGADAVLPLAGHCADLGLGVFLFGSTDTVLSRVQAALLARFPTLRIVGRLAPSARFDINSAEADGAIETIARSGADLCLIALTAPRQELFAHRASQSTSGCAYMCVGAALDFIAGTQARAPKVLQRAGLEWLWRLASHPARLGRRYFDCAVLMAIYLLEVPAARWRGEIRLGR